MSEVRSIKLHLQSICSQLASSVPDDLLKVITLLAIAQHHVEQSGHPSRGETLYVLMSAHKVLEKYNDMMSVRPHLMNKSMEENFAKHTERVTKQLKQFCKELDQAV